MGGVDEVLFLFGEGDFLDEASACQCGDATARELCTSP
jgi:hypothetical protein